MLLVVKDMRERFDVPLATARNPSMQGVGTKVGTVRWGETIGRILKLTRPARKPHNGVNRRGREGCGDHRYSRFAVGDAGLQARAP